MALFQDKVTLELNGEVLGTVSSYEITEGVLNQPNRFTLTLGHSGIVRELLERYPKASTVFQLRINGAPIQKGYLDGPQTGDGNGATVVTFHGRDLAARLHDAFILEERSFSERTFTELTRAALDTVGLKDEPIFPDNTANRKAISGTDIVAKQVVTEIVLDDGSIDLQVTPGTKKARHRTIEAKLGQRWYDFLKKQFERAGLFLWAGGGGGFILTAPNTQQVPIYRIVRRRGQTDRKPRVLRHSYRDDAEGRYTKAIIYGSGGGRNFGRTKNVGIATDPEMIALLGGEDVKPYVQNDDDSKTPRQAAYFARRKIAELNRDGWQLHYTLAGHSVPTLSGNGRAVWTPDTMCEVDDDELGVYGTFYVEACTHSRSNEGGTITTVHLCKPSDMVFATDIDAGTTAPPRTIVVQVPADQQ